MKRELALFIECQGANGPRRLRSIGPGRIESENDRAALRIDEPAPVAVTPEPIVQMAPQPAAEPVVRALPQEPAIKPDQILAQERSRIAGIYEAARKLHVDQKLADDLVKRGTSLSEARALLIDAAALADAAVETRPHVRAGELDATETRRAAVETALLHRFEPGKFRLTDAAREWRGLSLIEMARSFLEAEGTRVKGMGRDEIATRALHTGSDFPQILAGVTNRTLRDAYEAAPHTYQAIARRATVADFKSVQRLQLGEAPQLEKVNEAGEFKRGSIGEAIVILDADEAADDADPTSRPSRAPRRIAMTPEIYILLGARPEELGTAINTLRARLVKTILADAQLAGIVGSNGDIRYEGCATALARGRSMEGEMGVSFSFAYVLRPEEL